jgi:hypothetical protein
MQPSTERIIRSGDAVPLITGGFSLPCAQNIGQKGFKISCHCPFNYMTIQFALTGRQPSTVVRKDFSNSLHCPFNYRKIQFAPTKPGRQPSTVVRKDFAVSWHCPFNYRKIQFAPTKPGRQPSTVVRKDFALSPGELELEATLDK